MAGKASLRRPLNAAGFSRAMGGSRLWSLLVVAAMTLRVLRRFRKGDDEPLYRTVVRPGDRFEVVARTPR